MFGSASSSNHHTMVTRGKRKIEMAAMPERNDRDSNGKENNESFEPKAPKNVKREEEKKEETPNFFSRLRNGFGALGSFLRGRSQENHVKNVEGRRSRCEMTAEVQSDDEDERQNEDDRKKSDDEIEDDQKQPSSSSVVPKKLKNLGEKLTNEMMRELKSADKLKRSSESIHKKVDKIMAGRNVDGECWRRFKDFSDDVLVNYCQAANAHGTTEMLAWAPGMPSRRFGRKDLKKFGKNMKKVERVVKMKTGEDLILFEGCTIDAVEATNVNNLPGLKDEKDKDDQRRRFRNFMKQHSLQDVGMLSKDLSSFYWMYEYLSAFHTKINQKDGLPATNYFLPSGLDNKTLLSKFPRVMITNQYLLSDRAILRCARNVIAKHIDELIERNPRPKGEKTTIRQKTCSSLDCKCGERYRISYKCNYVWAQYLETGQLDVHNWRCPVVIIECSDACGCTQANCCTRQLQRGAKVKLAIMYEGEKGFGVRATENIKKGQLIGEYAGLVQEEFEREAKQKYLMMVQQIVQPKNENRIYIDAYTHGNIIRFLNHSCQPNTFFAEVHSRVKESHLLIPRLACFAERDINKGEEITVAYYTKETLDDENDKIPCRCGARRCIKNIPSLESEGFD